MTETALAYADRALALIREANKSLFVVTNARMYADLFKKGGNLYMAAHKFKEAGDAYVSAARNFIRVNDQDQATLNYINASRAYENEYPGEAVQCLTPVIDHYVVWGEFAKAAKYQEQQAVLNDRLGDTAGALRCWETAAGFFEIVRNDVASFRCRARTAEHYALVRDYEKADGLFQSLEKSVLASEIGYHDVPTYVFNATLCQFLWLPCEVVESIFKTRIVDQYAPLFSVKNRMVDTIITAVKANDPGRISSFMSKYTEVGKVTEWQATMLGRIRDLFTGVEE